MVVMVDAEANVRTAHHHIIVEEVVRTAVVEVAAVDRTVVIAK
jgi:hypothetical protein